MSGRSPIPAVLGHERPRNFLRGVINRRRIPTGFLFYGPEAIGKRMVAREFLMAVYCRSGQETGCGECPSCAKFAAGTHPDVEWIGLEEGKTTIPIDRVRVLREWFTLAPFESERRAAVIDRSDRMQEEAQNSLLKLLEEPPAHGLFILITTDQGGVLETILSRLQRVYFGPLDVAHSESLAENHGVDASRLREVWSLAGGSPGRALGFARDETVQKMLIDCRRIFETTPPFGRTESLLAGEKNSVGERERLVALLEAALVQVRSEWSSRLGNRLSTPGRLSELEPLTTADLEDVLRDIQKSITMARAYVAPKLVLDALLIRLQRFLALARRTAGRV